MTNHPSPFKKIQSMDIQAPQEVKAFASKMRSNEVPTKELWMARMSALKASCEMTKIWGDSIKPVHGSSGGSTLDDLGFAKKLRFQQDLWYKEFLNDITKDDSEIPF